jgi:hypothetical protein
MAFEAFWIAFWGQGQMLGSAFLGGVVGNLSASLLYDSGKWLLDPLLIRMPALAELFANGGTEANHDLLRAVRRAECRAFTFLCDQTLRDDYGFVERRGLRRLKDYIRKRKNPELVTLLRLRRLFYQRYQELPTLAVTELARFEGVKLADVPLMVRAGRETCGAPDYVTLGSTVSNRFLEALDEAIPEGVPNTLRERMRRPRGGWFDSLRLAFREELKDNERARVAFQLDVQSLVPEMLGSDYSVLEQRLSRFDETLSAVWNEVKLVREDVSVVIELIGDVLDQISALERSIRDLNTKELSETLAGVGWKAPFAHNQAFKGRSEDLEKLGEKLGIHNEEKVPSARAVVYGLPGVGKTALAIEWCWIQRSRTHSVLWIDASSPEAIDGSLTELANALTANEKLRFNVKGAMGTSELVARVVAWLDATPGWFLIADNCDSTTARDTLRTRLKEGLPGYLIITSCLQDWPQAWGPLHLDVFSEDSAVEFLLEYSGQHFTAVQDQLKLQASQLAKILGFLPLALDQAAAYIRHEAIEYVTYLQRLQETPNSLLGALGDDEGRRHSPALKTFGVAVKERNPLARALLRIVAFYDPDAVPRDLLLSLPQSLTAAISSAVVQEKGYQISSDESRSAEPGEALMELRNYSLLSHIDKNCVCTHRLIQAIEKSLLDEASRTRWLKISSDIARKHIWADKILACRTFVALEAEWNRTAELFPGDHDANLGRVLLMFDLSLSLLQTLRFEEGVIKLREAIRICEGLIETPSEQEALLLIGLMRIELFKALCLQNKGSEGVRELASATEALLRLLKSSLESKDHWDSCFQLLLPLVDATILIERYSDARTFVEGAQAICAKHLSETGASPLWQHRLCEVQLYLARIERHECKYDSARRNYETAVRICEDNLQLNPADSTALKLTMQSHMGLAYLFTQLNLLQEAHEEFLKVFVSYDRLHKMGLLPPLASVEWHDRRDFLFPFSGTLAPERVQLKKALFTALLVRDPTNAEWEQDLQIFTLISNINSLCRNPIFGMLFWCLKLPLRILEKTMRISLRWNPDVKVRNFYRSQMMQPFVNDLSTWERFGDTAIPRRKT